MIEIHEGSGDIFKFEYITKNFSKELNHGIIRLLEFREKLFTIQNFDILNFAKSFDTIEIHEAFLYYVLYDRYATWYIEILKGVVGRMKYIISKEQDMDSRDLMIKEVLITVKIINSTKMAEKKRQLKNLS